MHRTVVRDAALNYTRTCRRALRLAELVRAVNDFILLAIFRPVVNVQCLGVVIPVPIGFAAGLVIVQDPGVIQWTGRGNCRHACMDITKKLCEQRKKGPKMAFMTFLQVVTSCYLGRKCLKTQLWVRTCIPLLEILRKFGAVDVPTMATPDRLKPAACCTRK